MIVLVHKRVIITKLFNFNEKRLEFKVPNGSDWKCTCLAMYRAQDCENMGSLFVWGEAPLFWVIGAQKSRVEMSIYRHFGPCWWDPPRCLETSGTTHLLTLCNIPEERRPQTAQLQKKKSPGIDLFSVRIQVFQGNCKWIALSQTFSVFEHNYRVFTEHKVCGSHHIVAGSPQASEMWYL